MVENKSTHNSSPLRAKLKIVFAAVIITFW